MSKDFAPGRKTGATSDLEAIEDKGTGLVPNEDGETGQRIVAEHLISRNEEIRQENLRRMDWGSRAWW
jgi:hypothetical protein